MIIKIWLGRSTGYLIVKRVIFKANQIYLDLILVDQADL